ncbi:TPA: outer membrane protein assembly factor [Vibrio parahaemolyticus]|uniref:autotransporter assembly complex protein TamA n=1 Tax=Vibrio parahaemolyticus TaxID=670 RepID=UPI0015F39AA0|nr:autotransporter assembly complex family protein [Vibrio parahaemolyticus]EJG0649315.1 outer membrane protein assembly factor [Vibrio parahaemolyticus]MCI9706795.1 outer membrane protein assembly factor [Vibrio parahaemolyticus]MDF4637124.1 autotransporter assembly complex protein TamA [Vibrio parahaemolyticus]MDF5483160.1 autotransporter assembly complex protein TamA [Vibrio parahaemolyticus]MDG2620458.1 autotransporter assembly complex protein TamA [Vibrio parahaemolyticus]
MASLVQKLVGISIFVFIPFGGVLAAEFTIQGLSKPLERNLEYYLMPLADTSANDIPVSQLSKLVRLALNPYGYYHSELNVQRGENDLITLDVDAGEVMLVAKSNIVVSGEASNDEDFIELINQAQLKQGQPLLHSEYDTLKRNLISLAQQKGYLDGRFIESSLEVIPSLNQAHVNLYFSSGPRYQFGELSVLTSGIETARIEAMRTFERGDDFDTLKLSQYQADLSSTDWFRSVIVKADFEEISDGQKVPIEVLTEPNSRNIVQVGGGYSTDLGLRASLNWTKPWYNKRGHSFEAQAYASKPEQSLLLGYKIPTQNVLTDYYGIQFESKHVDYRDTSSFSNDLSFEKHWQLDSDWQSTMHVRYLQERYQQASENNDSQMLLPGVTFSLLDRKNDQLEIKHRHVYSLEYSDPNFFSDSRLLRIEGNSVLSWDISEKHKFHFRSNVGINVADALSDIPSSLRFFAGGDGNLRGYGYESISPRDENGDLTGARYMFTAGLEYQYQVYHQLWLGAFYDVGDAFNDSVDWKSGTGLSLIWNSKYVPVKVDFAYGLDAPQGDQFRVHFSLGTQF